MSSASFWRAVLEALPVAVGALRELLSGAPRKVPAPPARSASVTVIDEERRRAAERFRSSKRTATSRKVSER